MTVTEDTTAKPRFVILDPTKVSVHPNVRHDLGDLKALTQSVKALGVLTPVVAIEGEDGQPAIVIGQRRHSAAAACGRELPTLIAEDMDDAERIARQLAENFHRKDLTPTEEGKAFEQLALLGGLTDAAIAKMVGVPKDRVQKARTVAGSEVATAVSTRHDLTLDQLVVLTEFEDDKEAVRDLTVTARKDPGQFEHLASELRQERELAVQLAATTEALAAQGIAVVDSVREYPNALTLSRLTDTEDGTPLTPESHAECPGRIAVVPAHEPDHPRHYCIDPDAHGHRDLWAGSVGTSRGSASGPMTEDQKAERRKVIANNKKWKAATPVRHKHLSGLLTRKSAPKGTLRYVVGEVLTAPGRVGDARDSLMADLLGIKPPSGGRRVAEAHLDKVSEAQLPLALLAQVAAAIEQSMDEHTWRQHSPVREATYFMFLASTGYSLSEIEQLVVDLAFPPKAATKRAPSKKASPEATPPAEADAPDADAEAAPAAA